MVPEVNLVHLDGGVHFWHFGTFDYQIHVMAKVI